jgi:hypothetical protein
MERMRNPWGANRDKQTEIKGGAELHGRVTGKMTFRPGQFSTRRESYLPMFGEYFWDRVTAEVGDMPTVEALTKVSMHYRVPSNGSIELRYNILERFKPDAMRGDVWKIMDELVTSGTIQKDWTWRTTIHRPPPRENYEYLAILREEHRKHWAEFMGPNPPLWVFMQFIDESMVLTTRGRYVKNRRGQLELLRSGQRPPLSAWRSLEEWSRQGETGIYLK